MLDLYLQMYDVSYFEARGRHKPLGLYGGGEVHLKRSQSLAEKDPNLFARCLVTGGLLVPPTTRDNETIQGRDTLAAPRLLRRVRPTRSQSSSRWARQTNRPVLAQLFSLRSISSQRKVQSYSLTGRRSYRVAPRWSSHPLEVGQVH